MGVVGSQYRLNQLILCLALACLAGCSGGHQPAVSSAPVQAVPAVESTSDGDAAAVITVRMQPQAIVEPGFRTTSLARPNLLDPGLPAPRTVSDTGEIITIAAADFDPGLSSRNVEARGDYALFQPDWYSPATDTMEQTAYCSFSFDLGGFTGLPTLSIIWTEKAYPVTQFEYWVGIANYERNCWDFFEGPLDQVITLESLAPYTSGSGRMIVVPVMVSACRVAVLEELKLGVAETRATGLIEGEVTFTCTEPLLWTGTLPTAADLSPDCAPVGDQLTWGSCTAFAVSNGAFNHVLGLIYGAAGWDLADTAFQASPKFTHVESGKDPAHTDSAFTGRYLNIVAEGLCDYGVATEQSAPYDMVYDDEWSAAALADAAVLRATGAAELLLEDAASLQQVKYLLAVRHQPVVLTTNIDQAFSDYTAGAVWSYAGPKSNRHTMLITGYDDGRGAFLVRNSWGADWGSCGSCWIAYDSLLNIPADTKAGHLTAEYSAAAAQRFLGEELATPPPVDIQAGRGSQVDAVHLSWTAPAAATSFNIYRDTATIPLAGTSELEWDDTTLADNLGHTYWVRAVYPAGSSILSSPATGFLKHSTATITSVSPIRCGRHQLVTFEPVIDGASVQSYFWDFGAAGTPATSTEETPTILTGAAGEYQVRFVITDALGSDETLFSLTIADNDAPASEFSMAPAIVYPGEIISFDAGASSDPSGRIVLYEWDWEGDGTYDTALTTATVTHSYDVYPAEYDPVLRVTDDGGLTDTSTRHAIALDYHNPPSATFTMSSADGTWQPPATITFDATESFDYDDDIVFYEWDFDGDGEFDYGSIEPTTTELYPDHFTTDVKLRVTDLQGLPGEASRPLAIGLGAPVPDWTVHGVINLDCGTDCRLDLETAGGRPVLLAVDATGELHVILAESTPGHHSDWYHDRPTGPTTVTGGASLAIDAGSCPVIAYHALAPQAGLYFAQYDAGTGWSCSAIWQDATDTPGYINDIETVDGRPAVACSLECPAPSSAVGLYCALATRATPAGPGDWEITQVSAESELTAPVRLRQINGLPALVYSAGSTTAAATYYACRDTSGTDDWVIHEIEPGNLGSPAAGLVELRGMPLALSTLGETPTALHLIRGQVTEPEEYIDWFTMSSETSDYPVLGTDMELIAGLPWIAWRQGSTPTGLLVTYTNDDTPSDDGDWRTEAVCSGDYHGLRLTDAGGQPALVFYRPADGWIYYATPD